MIELINLIYVLIEKELLFKKVVLNNIEQELLDESNVFYCQNN